MPVTSTRVKDFYAVLGITRTATEEDIKAAFKALALQWHPDRHPKGKEEAARKFIEINEAYKFLMDKNRKAWYDNAPATGNEIKRSRARTTEGSRGSSEVPLQSTTRIRAKSDTMEKTTPSPAGQDTNTPEKTGFFSTPSNAKAGQAADAVTESEGKPLDGKKMPLPNPVSIFNMTESWAQFAAKATNFLPPSGKSKLTTGSSNGKGPPPSLVHAAKASSLKDGSEKLFTRSTSASSILGSRFTSPSTIPKTSLSSENLKAKSVGGKIEKIERERLTKGDKSTPSLKSRNATIYEDSDNDIPSRKLGVRLKTTTDATAGTPSEWVFQLPLTLEELYEGTSHRYRITRSLLSGEKKSLFVDIEVAPGWKEGTKIRFPGAGNERRNDTPQDIVFVVQELPHSRYKREGSALVANIPICPEDALVGSLDISLPGLDGKKIEITTPKSIKSGDEFIIRDSGMPIRRQGKFVGKGDMILRVVVGKSDSRRS